jgi:osmotically inducible lipoprotein OsmB
MNTRIVAPAIMLVALALAGCGTSQNDRALSGGAIGAGAGGLAGAAVGHPWAGAGWGGAGGAATGAYTNPNQVDLGRPAWR